MRIIPCLALMVCLWFVLGGMAGGVAMNAEPTPQGPAGTIQVDGVPSGMAIALDGVPYGNVPETGLFELPLIPVGSHTISASQGGYETKETSIIVQDGQISKIRVELPRLRGGTLEVLSVPPNVQVYLDDAYKGITPMTLTDVPAGAHTVLLRLTGYQDWSSPVTVASESRQTISGTMQASSDAGKPVPSATRSSGLPFSTVVLSLIVAVGGFMVSRRISP